jgi:hypothetical protein
MREGDNLIPRNASPPVRPQSLCISPGNECTGSVPTATGSRRVNPTRFASDPGTTVRRNDRRLRRSDTCAYVVVSLYTGRPRTTQDVVYHAHIVLGPIVPHHDKFSGPQRVVPTSASVGRSELNALVWMSPRIISTRHSNSHTAPARSLIVGHLY